MFNAKKKLLLYESRSGEAPFENWLENLGDRQARHIIRARLDRLAYGVPGKCRAVGGGVFELKIFFGPGYRVYYGEEGVKVIVLLYGGDKSTQTRDIQAAHKYWNDHKERK